MSRSDDTKSKTPKPLSLSSLGSISDRFNSAMAFDGNNKPDSPVSPLGPRFPTSSSSSSSSGKPPSSLSGELSGSNDGSPRRPLHRRSGSGPLIYSGGGSTASSPAAGAFPAGNICPPSGKIAKTGFSTTKRSDVLGSGKNYGHGSVIRGHVSGGICGGSADPEELTRAGNEKYKRGQLAEAVRIYDRTVDMCPRNPACRSNRAAALEKLGRLGEATRDCEEAVRLDPGYGRAHLRLASLHLRFGRVEDARRHLNLAGKGSHTLELQKLQLIDRHMGRCEEARKIRDWKSALREADAAIAAGADSSPLLFALRAEALLRLHHLEKADSTLSNSPKIDTFSSHSKKIEVFGMMSDSYVFVVRAHVEMALGRFENAVKAAEKAREIDPRNAEVMVMLNNTRLVARARDQGNELFKSGNFFDACEAYGEGLKYDPLNPVLHCNRAACFTKLGQWVKSVDDCNEALRIQPNYTKALLRRAASNAKLERWVESVRDYEELRKELPDDTEVADSLFHAQVALKASRGEEISNMKFGGEVEEIIGLEQFQAAISLPGISVVYFMDSSNKQCAKVNQFVDSLCNRYPSLNFLKVNTKESQDVARAENVVIVPTFKIYRKGSRVKEMIRPNPEVLEYSVRHYGV